MDSQKPGESSPPPPSLPYPSLPGRKLRQASLILPSTGQKVKRDFTLRDPTLWPATTSTGSSSETSPLLPPGTNPAKPPGKFQTYVTKTATFLKASLNDLTDFLQSDSGHGIFKCSLAYFIATLATFSDPVARVLGTHQDGNQLVANVVVWFDPFRSEGSMELATILATLAFLYGAIIAFSSMGVSAWFASRDLMSVGYTIVVVFFVGGSLGLLSWVKQYFNHPILNTANSLASLVIVTVLTKEGAVQLGDFSIYKILQILKMSIMGVIISVIVNLTIWPTSARRKLRESLTKSTSAFGDLLAMITGSFLSGLEEDFTHPVVVAASDRFKSVFSSLPTHLSEAKYEHHLLGSEKRYHIEQRLVKCMQQLAQDIGGLRSAAAMQFSLLADGSAQGASGSLKAEYKFDNDTHNLSHVQEGLGLDRATLMLASIEDADEDEPNERASTSSGKLGDTCEQPSTQTAVGGTTSEVFETFISQLGPPMKSLAFTLREILNNLPYQTQHGAGAVDISMFRSSLVEAISLFGASRKEALLAVYKSKELSVAQDIPVAADFEEVAASCGQFASSLQDFAENCVKYMDVLEELQLELSQRWYGLSWTWLLFWRKTPDDDLEQLDHDAERRAHKNTAAMTKIQKLSTGIQPPAANADTGTIVQQFPYRFYPYVQFWSREDIRFAIKVGGGAALYAMFAFIPATRDFYDEWHLEWGLVAYMIVCSMTVGASNTTGLQRFVGTLIGGATSIVVWLMCFENPWALALSGWFVSAVCFYWIIVRNQAPMGRFILLTYNLSVLYSYALTIQDPDIDGRERDDQKRTIFGVVFHRVVAIIMGALSGVFITRAIWPIKARTKLKYGLSLLWLRMALIWKQGPLSVLIDDSTDPPPYSSLSSETTLREYVDILDTVRKNAESEFKMRGPFLTDSYDALLKSTSRMLDAFHALNVVILKDLKASTGEVEILRYTTNERKEMATRLSHLLSVLAASVSLEYPITDELPDIKHTRDRLLAKVFELRGKADKAVVAADDYEILYAYALVTRQIAKEIEISAKEIEKLFGTLNYDVVTLQ